MANKRQSVDRAPSDVAVPESASRVKSLRKRTRSIVRPRKSPGPELEKADSNSRPTVLLIEDNPATRRVVRLTLEQHGFHVLEAADGSQALRALELERPRLVLQDLMLPDIDGFELVSALRKTAGNSKIAVLAFSGMFAQPDTARLKAAGFDDLVSKPVDGERLAAVLEAHWLLTAPAPERFGAGRSLLIADGDALKRRVTRLRLERAGFKVRTAANGMEALELARHFRPDVLVADVMMPRLDGFGLCMALRQEPALRALTVLLVSSSNVDDAERAHARRSGANRLIQHSPDLKELTQALRGTTLAPEAAPILMPDAMLGLEKERSARLLAQLERQVVANQRLARKCAALAAELTVFSGLSEAVIRSGDLSAALDEALATCLDAGGISAGVLYLLDGDTPFQVRSLGALPGWDTAELRSFFGHEALLRWIVNGKRMLEVPSRDFPTDLCIDLLEKSGASNLLVVPLVWRETPLGALVMISREREIDRETWRSFAQGMANHITQALALIDAFASKERARAETREQAGLLRAVLDNISDGVVVVDQGGKFVLWNSAARAIAGERTCPIEDWPERYRIRYAEGGKSVPLNELPLLRALTGEVTNDARFLVQPEPTEPARLVTASARPLSNERGERAGAMAVFRDVTDRPAVARLHGKELASGRAQELVDVPRALDAAVTFTLDAPDVRWCGRVVKRYERVPLALASATALEFVLQQLIQAAALGPPARESTPREIRLCTALNAAGRVVVSVAASGEPQWEEPLWACGPIVAALGAELVLGARENGGSGVELVLRASTTRVSSC